MNDKQKEPKRCYHPNNGVNPIRKNVWKEGESKYPWNKAGTLKDYEFTCHVCGEVVHFLPA
jgi:hypothetical protein